MSPVTVRRASAADRDAWLRLRVALWPDAPESHAREIDQLFTSPDPHWPQAALLAERDGQVIGLAEVSIRPHAEGCETRTIGYLEGWYVAPEHRRKGIGRALVDAAESWARERGCTEMASDTEPENEASRRAHAACGFEEAGQVVCLHKRL